MATSVFAPSTPPPYTSAESLYFARSPSGNASFGSLPPPLSPNSLAAASVVPGHMQDECMVVVDPMTRKLPLPWECILPTRAQQRASIPSLCQLFLQGRCRQGFNCHQVHADPLVVERLRMQVQSLPVCCTTHGDGDHTDGPHDPRLILVSNLLWNDGLIPIHRLSNTVGLQRIVQMNQVVLVGDRPAIAATGSFANICRLHVVDRCRFAEDCKFLHVCKHVAAQDPLFQSAHSGRPQHQRQAFTSPNASYSRGAPMPPSPLFVPSLVHEMPQVLNLSITEPGCATPPTPLSAGEASPGAMERSSSRRYSSNGAEWTHEPYRMWESLSHTLQTLAPVEAC